MYIDIPYVYLYSICIVIRKKVSEISGIRLFPVTHFDRELTRAAFRIACVAYARALSLLIFVFIFGQFGDN